MAVSPAVPWVHCVSSADGRWRGIRLLVIAGICAFLAACQSATVDTARSGAAPQAIPDVPITQGRYTVGKPYRKNGVLYRPAENWSYNEVGVASWYGMDHHGKRTANGETFDLRALTAAHPTLPLPSRVRVTNIENGKSIVVRVNDRGPFKNGRLIDVSRRAADMLGFRERGTARVRVEMLGRAPLEMFRMAKPKGPAPDLPVRAAPSAAVKAAALPSPSASGAERKETDAAQEQDQAAATVGENPPVAKATKDPLGDLIESMEAQNQAKDRLAEASGTTDSGGKAAGSAAGVPASGRETSAPSADRQFFIQAGAFTVPENAYSLRRLIIKAINGANVSINPAQVGDREFFRVRVGPFPSNEEAKGMLAQLRNMGQNEAKIIMN